jgi:flagellar biosynthesis/type III secretory pathway chaperone
MSPLEAELQHLSLALEAFVTLLREESAALAAADSARLEALLPRRGEAQARTAEAWQRLTQRLQLGQNASLAALRQRLYPQQAPEPWLRLEQHAQEAARLNQLNTQLIDEQMRRTQAALQVLQNAASRRGLYGSDGRLSDSLTTTRTIDTV